MTEPGERDAAGGAAGDAAGGAAGDAAGEASVAQGERSHREIQIILVGLMLGMLLPAMTMTVVSTALPAIVSDLGGISELPWVVTAYLVAATVAVPLVGKASDVVGRRPLFLASIAGFVVGSLLCGLAQSMGQLIAARAVQGVAGGSLMALAQATIGDVVSPRQRGRYQGYIGAVFAVSSVAGPLIGGVVADQLSWRWVFLLNVPLGAAAFLVTRRFLRLTHQRRAVRVDVLGALLVVVGATALLLVASWGGQELPWGSPVIVSLAAVALLCVVALVPVERRAAEPIIPLRLFREPVFTIGSALTFLVAAGMFGAIVFLPTFLQIASGVSATASGLALLPLMSALLLATTVSGRLITRWGRYKAFPVLGTALLLTGFALLATMSADTPVLQIAAYLVLVGLGIGMTMQNVVLAIQNAVPTADLGAATAAAQFFRMIGGTLGLAAFGTVMTTRLSQWAERALPGGQLPGGLDLDLVASDPTAIARLPEGLQEALRDGLATSITFTFLVSVPLLVLAFVLALRLREVPLRETAADRR